MKTRVLPLVSLVLVGMFAAAEPVGPPAPKPAPKPAAKAGVALSAWLGIKICRPSPEVRAHLPGLPKGTGFVIEEVDPDGPAIESGLAANDVIWKLNDQLLINEAQLAVLLSQHKPGEEVEIDYYRAGRPATAKLVLGEAPLDSGFEVERRMPPLVTAPGLPGMPTRIVNVPSRTASIDNEDGKAELTMGREGFKLVISDSLGRTTHEGALFDIRGRISAPVEWRERVESLHAALLESMQRPQPARQPRLRVIPKVRPKETGGS